MATAVSFGRFAGGREGAAVRYISDDPSLFLGPPRLVCRSSSALQLQLHSFWALTFFVRFNFVADPLAFIESLQAGLFQRGDMHENVASAVVRLDESISFVGIEKLDRA